MASRLPPPRRIVTSNLPLPATSESSGAEPAVQVLCEDLRQESELDGNSYRGTVFTHDKFPTSNDGLDIAPKEPPSLVIPNGANIRFNDLAPGQAVPMHRTQTTDYNVVLIGEIYLLTPEQPTSVSEHASAQSTVRETLCRPGDVILQRGTLHGWKNRSNEWVRTISVMIGSEVNKVPVDGGEGTVVLEDCFGK